MFVSEELFFFFPHPTTHNISEKKTLQLISLVGPLSSSSDFTLLRRQEEISKSIHVSVHFKVSVFQYKFENRSLGKLRALLSDYFKYKEKNAWNWQAPEKEELFVEFISQNENPETDSQTTDVSTNEETQNSLKENKDLFTEHVSKVARMEFPIQVTNESNKSTSCTTELYWVKENRRWYIKKIYIFNCSSL